MQAQAETNTKFAAQRPTLWEWCLSFILSAQTQYKELWHLSHTCRWEMSAVRLSKQFACCMLSRFSCVQICATLWTAACQATLSMGFCRKEYWSGLLCPTPADLPNPGIEPMSPMSPAFTGGFFTTSTTWEAPNSYKERSWNNTKTTCLHNVMQNFKAE